MGRLSDQCDHLRLAGHGHGPALLGLGLEAPLVRLGLVGLELGADVLPDVHVGDVDGRYLEGGSGFKDKSALSHIHGEYKISEEIIDIVLGGSYRLYNPNSSGTIFSDTGGVVITNYEYGLYTSLEKRFFERDLIVTATARLDKNENFNFLLSPAVSVVYRYDANKYFRLSFSSAIRNPTLQDQYLFYNLGPAILVGNINGFDSLVTFPSL
ncbi:hypothetical protein LCGC14_2210630, partial [marine sediment metagenome]